MKREKFLRFLVHRVFKFKVGCCYPKWFRWLFLYPLFPIRFLIDKNPWFTYDIAYDTIVVKGMRISVESLFYLASKENIGKTFEIVEHTKYNSIAIREVK